MVDPYRMPNINTKGLYTTIVPLESLKEYDHDCSSCGNPLNEVNVVISKAIVLDLPSTSKIGCINVVKGDPFRSYEDEEVGTIWPKEKLKGRVEVTFDIIHRNKATKLETTCCFPFGIHVNEPYPHFLIGSLFDNPIQEEYITRLLNSSEVKSILVNRVKEFKEFWRCSNRINVREGGSIVIYGKELGVKFRIGNPGGEIDFEVPTYSFKGLFNFIGSSKPKFEILKTIFPDFIIKHEHYLTYAAFNRVFD